MSLVFPAFASGSLPLPPSEKPIHTHTHKCVLYIYIYIYIFYLTSFLLFTERLLTICAFVQILLYSQIILLDISYFQKYKNFF